MLSIAALIKRISCQFIRDRRTLALLIVAPLFIFTLLWVVFTTEAYEPKIAVINEDTSLQSPFEKSDYVLLTEGEAKKMLNERKIDAYLRLFPSPTIYLEGSEPAKNQAVLMKLQKTMQTMKEGAKQELEIHYLHGSKDLTSFDAFGPVLLGFFTFFFVFLISGVSFLRERTTGTLDRLMASPIKNSEIILGYLIGFGIFASLQSVILTSYGIYVLKMYHAGRLIDVLMIILILSFSALTLGMLLSAFARNELQLMQFIPVVIIPQVFFSGIFQFETLPEWAQWLGKATPLYYAADALKGIMLRGEGFASWWGSGLVLIGFSFLFIWMNLGALRAYRK